MATSAGAALARFFLFALLRGVEALKLPEAVVNELGGEKEVGGVAILEGDDDVEDENEDVTVEAEVVEEKDDSGVSKGAGPGVETKPEAGDKLSCCSTLEPKLECESEEDP